MTSLVNTLMHTWHESRLKSLLNITYPLLQAPMAGGITTPELVAAVSNTGGLGSLGAGYMSPPAIREAIKTIRRLTTRNFAVNLFIPEQHHADLQQKENMVKQVNQICAELNITVTAPEFPYSPAFDAQLEVILDEHVPIFSFTFGIPESQWIKKLKSNKTIIMGTATTLPEAKQLETSGVDIIVAQSSEAGGHRGTFIGDPFNSLIGTASLIPQLVNNIHVPVVAAGGIMDAKTILAALMLGADGVQMGTAFLTCTEAATNPEYKKILLNKKYDNTVLTKVFSGKLARGIKNKFIEEMQDYVDKCLDYPIQNALTKSMRLAAAQQNNIDFMSLWAGQAAHLCQSISAVDLVNQINKNIELLLATD